MPPIDTENSIVLLGAGASQPAGVPTALEMTGRMLAKFRDDRLQRLYLRTTKMIVGALQMAAGARREEPNSNIDIEQVLSAAKLLGTRFDTELSPFVGGWHPFLEELERTFIDVPFGEIQEFGGAEAQA
jgi:hypothetical protein